MNLLQNPGFEADWSEESSHACLVVPKDGDPYQVDIGNIFTPPGWLVFFYHDPDTWDQPEVRDAWASDDARRARSGEKGILLFTFFRKHVAGFLQQVQVTPGARLKLSAYAHAWSNHIDGPHPDDPYWSEGVGYDVAWYLQGSTDDSDIKNFTFKLAIDPTGGINPFDQETVVYGDGAHIYNGYADPVPAVEVVAESDVVTVFLRSVARWPFKHNDAYWDDVLLEVIGELPPDECRGHPRVQYRRNSVLVPPPASDEPANEWAVALSQRWDELRYVSITASADDAGVGDLDERNVIAVNPQDWTDDLKAFYEEHYPGVGYYPVEATVRDVAEKVAKVLESIEGGGPPPPPPPPPPPLPPWAGKEVITLHVQQPTAHEGYGDLEFARDVLPAGFKTVGHMQQLQRVKQVSPDTVTIYRQFVDNQGLYWDNPSPQQGAREFLYTFLDSLLELQDYVDLVQGLNEIGVPDEMARLAEFECWFAEALVEEGLPAKPCLLAIPVGNPRHPWEGGLAHIEEMLPAVEKVVELGGAIGYNAYFRVENKIVDPPWPDNMLHYFGRCLLSWDPVFNDNGLYPNYVMTEGGAFLNALAGWKHCDVFDGDWARYGQSLLRLRSEVNAWNEAHDWRAICYCLFTYANPGIWQYYNLYGYARALAELLTGG